MFWTRRILHGPSAFLTFVFCLRGDPTMRLSTTIIAATALAGSFATAHAVPAVQAGLLECRGGQNVGFVVGSVANLECVFQSPGRRPEAYVATVRRIGIDLGVTAQTQFVWAVSAPTTRLGLGELTGTYGGVGANASIGGGGGGGTFLAGGPGKPLCLPPHP